MLGLLELQRSFAAGLHSGDMSAVAALIADGPIAPADRMRIHRNTMLTALAGALRLSYPAVDALVGAAFFDQVARDFIQLTPPSAALLTLYGAEFPAFLEAYAPAAGLPYLAEVARLEWAVELAARGPAEGEASPSADLTLGDMRLTLAPSLALLRTQYPAEPIWRAVLDGDDAALGCVDPRPATSYLAIWREADGAAVASLGPVPAVFLDRLLAGVDGETALAEAALAASDTDPIRAISVEILSANFARITPVTRHEGEQE